MYLLRLFYWDGCDVGDGGICGCGDGGGGGCIFELGVGDFLVKG